MTIGWCILYFQYRLEVSRAKLQEPQSTDLLELILAVATDGSNVFIVKIISLTITPKLEIVVDALGLGV